MTTLFRGTGRRFLLQLPLSATMFWSGLLTNAATLQDFGYQNKKPLAHRPLLVIIAEFEGTPNLTHDRSFYDELVFSLSRPSGSTNTIFVNAYFQEVSNYRFFWSRAGQGTIGPVPFTAAERNEIRLDDPAGISRVITKAATNGSGFSFDSLDANADGTITDDELGILIIHNGAGLGNRAIDPSGCLRPPGSTVNVCCGVATTCDQCGFATMVHEMSHRLGAIDLYYGAQGIACWSAGLTVMSCTGDTPVHLDPWHKLQFGWVEPRIRSLRSGGVEVLPVAQLLRADAPVILYDPRRGVSEFFLIEYRSRSVPNNAGYDAGVASEGLAVWHIKQDQNHNPVAIPGVAPYAVIHDGAPDWQLGGSLLWGSNSTLPYLRWLDGSLRETRIVVHPFNAGDSSISVEWIVDWIRDEWLWVNFNYSGTEFGTFDFPYNTLAEGVDNVPWGGSLTIKPGSSAERRTITKRMVIQAYGGPVTIGR